MPRASCIVVCHAAKPSSFNPITIPSVQCTLPGPLHSSPTLQSLHLGTPISSLGCRSSHVQRVITADNPTVVSDTAVFRWSRGPAYSQWPARRPRRPFARPAAALCPPAYSLCEIPRPHFTERAVYDHHTQRAAQDAAINDTMQPHPNRHRRRAPRAEPPARFRRGPTP